MGMVGELSSHPLPSPPHPAREGTALQHIFRTPRLSLQGADGWATPAWYAAQRVFWQKTNRLEQPETLLRNPQNFQAA